MISSFIKNNNPLPKVLISNLGFGRASPKSLEHLKNHANVIENQKDARFTEEDFFHYAIDTDIIIAGTEKITKRFIKEARNLKLIARIGSGVDNIDLDAACKHKINICYTPEAPSLGVPEFTLTLILNLIKGVCVADRNMHMKKWNKVLGRNLLSSNINIIGAGKIGKKLISLIHLISPKTNIGFYDPIVNVVPGAKKLTFEDVFKTADIVSLHVPLNENTHRMIGKKQLSFMPHGSFIINTSRGGVIDEEALYNALNNHLAGAAIDVFETEPYSGKLCELDNCILTPHLGSMSLDVRRVMEEQVSHDVIEFISGRPLLNPYIQGGSSE